jgi:hypothetical protein
MCDFNARLVVRAITKAPAGPKSAKLVEQHPIPNRFMEAQSAFYVVPYPMCLKAALPPPTAPAMQG